MSKKGKAILASALFGVAIFGASCGGGGGGTPASTGEPPSEPPTSPTTLAKILVQVPNVSFAGLSETVRVCDLLSNFEAQCGVDINPDNKFYGYIHEFSNRNVLLKSQDDTIRLFNGTDLVNVEQRKKSLIAQEICKKLKTHKF